MNYLFSPSAGSVYQFQPTLGGKVYTVRCPYNEWGKRYYVQILTVNQTPVYFMPLSGSPPDSDISLLPPLDPITGLPWTSTMVFREATQTFEVNP